jgi:hypothetical protein
MDSSLRIDPMGTGREKEMPSRERNRILPRQNTLAFVNPSYEKGNTKQKRRCFNFSKVSSRRRTNEQMNRDRSEERAHLVRQPHQIATKDLLMDAEYQRFI